MTTSQRKRQNADAFSARVQKDEDKRIAAIKLAEHRAAKAANWQAQMAELDLALAQAEWDRFAATR